MKKILLLILQTTFVLAVLAGKSAAYPLDGFDETDIPRLDGYYHSLLTDSGLQNLTAGALLSYSELRLSKPSSGEAFAFQQDSSLRSALADIVGNGVSVSLLDLSNPSRPAYAGVNDSHSFIPGSVGKMMVVVALFDALKRLHPDSIEMRKKLLRERFITANEFIIEDTHDVPFWDEQNRRIWFRPLIAGDRANLWTYLDWMMSASSNAAASMVMREVLLMNHFGSHYPPSEAAADAFFRGGAAARSMHSAFVQPIARTGLNAGRIFQASFFTKGAKKLVANQGSSATTRDLIHYLWLLEQGRLVDEFSSLEIKRLLYMTQKRERYAGAAALDNAAVYFKAGSLYRCGGPCEKYEGTLLNMLNGVAIVEYPVAEKSLYYMVAISSNVLRLNSNDLHNRLANRIHALIEARNRSR